MRKCFVVLLATAALGLAGATQAWASTVLFNPNGLGTAGALTIDLLDQAPGNGISLGLGATSAPGATGSYLYHANLSVAKLGSGVAFTQGGGGKFFTFDATLTETVTNNVAISGGQIITFGPPSPSGSQGFFRMYAHTGNGSDLNGKCFADDCGGILIMETAFINNGNFFGSFTANTAPAGSGNLDQFNANNYSPTKTISGTGGFTADMIVVSHLASYFPTLVNGTSFEFQSSQQNLPFHQVDPSSCFKWNLTDTVCSQLGVATVGATNGLSGPNTMLETDASTSFVQPVAVPEPATLALLGFGLLGATAARRRQLKKAKAKE